MSPTDESDYDTTILQGYAASDRPPAGEAPRTEAGRRFLASPDKAPLESWVLAIEREAATPPEPDLDVERLRTAIRLVADIDRYDLGYTREISRLAADVVAAYEGLSESGSPPAIDRSKSGRILSIGGESGSPPPGCNCGADYGARTCPVHDAAPTPPGEERP